jgi:UDP-2,3-diacylglucosamine pyrophosphatase LpxH
MRPTRILHISDLHLAQQPFRRSILDRSPELRAAFVKALRSDIRDAVRGKPSQLRALFKDLMNNRSIAALRQALKGGTIQQRNAALDQTLDAIVQDDASFRSFTISLLKDVTIASSFDPGLLLCLCNFIEQEDPNLDAIVVTGDLATTGFKVDLEKGLDFLEGSSVNSISSTTARKLLLPGNHDRYRYTGNGFLYAAGDTLFDATFKTYWSGPVQAYEPLRNGDGLSIIIIAADFSLQSNRDATLPFLKLSRLAQGKVYPSILKELVRVTKLLKTQERGAGYTPVTLWALHFPPFFVHQNSGRVDQTIHALTKNLINEEHLVARAKESNVYAILAGHTHEAQDYDTKRRGVRVLCAGSATQNDPSDKQCQIIEVSRNAINQPKVTVTEYGQDVSWSSFKPKVYF